MHFLKTKMNPCCKLSLFEGARYVAIADFVYSALVIVVLTLQLVNTFINGVAVNNENVPLSQTSITQVFVTHLCIGLVNLLISIILYRGITTENVQKCRTFLIISTLSTLFGFALVFYHGLHLTELQLWFFNSEFFISMMYHLYKIYALIVIFQFVRELDKFLLEGGGGGGGLRHQYQSLENDNEKYPGENQTFPGSGESEIVKHIFFQVPFSGRHFIPEERLQVDFDACIEYESDSTATVKGTFLQVKGQGQENVGVAVAVKLLKSCYRSEQHMRRLAKEAGLFAKISGCDGEGHENILKFVGVSFATASSSFSRYCNGHFMLVTEIYPSGRRLDDFLRSSYENRLLNFRNSFTFPGESSSESGNQRKRSRRLGTVYENLQTVNYHDLETFSSHNMLQWIYQLAKAVEYLHAKNIIVGNIQAKSLILFEVSHVKLSNFSLAAELQEAGNTISPISLSRKVLWQFMAIECLQQANEGVATKFSRKSDVWAFGAVVWQIFSMGVAPGLSGSLNEYLNALAKGKRPPRPEFCSESIYNLIKSCWTQKPKDRPDFASISLYFRQLLSPEDK